MAGHAAYYILLFTIEIRHTELHYRGTCSFIVDLKQRPLSEVSCDSGTMQDVNDLVWRRDSCFFLQPGCSICLE